MAGAGKKTFTAGETLTASDVNNYLGDQAVMYFGGTAARSSAIPTPTIGMTSYRGDTKQIESYDGAEWRGMSGLQLVKKQTIGTGVSSVSVSSAFSATYDNYKIIVAGGSASATGELFLSLNGITTAYYSQLQYNSYGATTPLAASTANAAYWNWAGTISSNGIAMNVDVASPFLSKFKSFQGSFAILQVAGGVSGSVNGIQASTSSATAFTLTTSTGTLTGGTIYVYGYGT